MGLSECANDNTLANCFRKTGISPIETYSSLMTEPESPLGIIQVSNCYDIRSSRGRAKIFDVICDIWKLSTDQVPNAGS